MSSRSTDFLRKFVLGLAILAVCGASGSISQGAEGDETVQKAISPQDGPIKLFNGENLDGF